MPTYEYRCMNCGNSVEVFQRFGDEPLTICDVCGGTLRKVFHPAGIVFKGSGFYATDTRSRPAADGKDGKKEDQKSGSGEGGSTKGSGAGSDSSSSSKPREGTS
jgi:putative FmdB family regulatory protein